MSTTKQIVKIDNLRRLFTYDHRGVPLLENFGNFTDGVSAWEIDAYLQVRANTNNIYHLRRKFYNIAGCNTCASITVEGKSICLMYRHDVKRFADKLFNGTPTYWD